jgi:enoyl-[acyl-carrier protein] reductase II
MTLIPQVVDAVNLPVIAAGGIADSRGVVAAIALGALGVQVGTSLLASTECPIHENYKLAVVKAKDSDTIVTGRSVKAPVRCFKNAMTQHYVKLEEEKASKEELEKLTMGSLRKAVVEGDSKNGSLMMGQIAGLVKEIKPLKEIFEDMVFGTTPLLDKLYENFR